jgi:hypothetical protein
LAEKWGRNLKNSTEDMRRGIERVTEAPSQKAIAAQAKMLEKLMEAIQSGRWAAGLEKVGLDDWKKAMTDKGLRRISAGVDGASDKMREFADWLLTRVDNAKAKINDMPSVTLEDNVNRMVTYIREMAKEKYKK